MFPIQDFLQKHTNIKRADNYNKLFKLENSHGIPCIIFQNLNNYIFFKT